MLRSIQNEGCIGGSEYFDRCDGEGIMVGGSFEIAGVVFCCYFACVVVVGKTVAFFDWPR